MVDIGGTAGSASQDLGSAIGSMLGDFGNDSAPDDQDAGVEAGAPPAEASPDAPESSPTPDAAPEVEPDASAPAPATPESPAPEDIDPLATAKSLTYTVNGQERTVEGIKVLSDELGGEGIITREALPDIIRRLGERDNLYEQNQWAFQQRQELEAASAWKVTKEDGSESLVTGKEGIAEMRIAHARQEASLQTLIAALQDPEQFRQMVAVDQNDQIVLNPQFIQSLLTRAELAEMKAEQATRGLFGQLLQAAQPAPAAPDFSRYAPAIIKQAAGDKFSTLSPKDQDTLGKQMLRYVRPSTPAERQAGQGPHIVDAEFASLVQEWVNLRSEGVKAATTAASASSSNAAKLAAARIGTKATTPAPSTRPPRAPAKPIDADTAWAMREKALAAGLNRR